MLIDTGTISHDRTLNDLPGSISGSGDRALWLFWLYLVAFVLVWMLLPLWLRTEPPGDNLEQLAWMQHPALGYTKHPPLPTWLLWLASQVAPPGIALTYVLGAVMVCLTLYGSWRLAEDLLGHGSGWYAVLLCTLITYYSKRLCFFNHNSVLLACTVFALLVLVTALSRNRTRDWVLLGVVWAAGMLSKYQMAITIICNLAAIALLLGGAGNRIRALVTSGTTALILFTPHLLWLVHHDFPPLHYAAGFVTANLPIWQRPWRILSFSAYQLARLAPLLAFLLLAGLFRRTHQQDTGWHLLQLQPHPQARPLLAIHALGPFALMLLLAIFFGTDLETHWGTAYLWATPLLLLDRGLRPRLAAVPTCKAIAIAAVVQAVVIVEYALPGM
ncbi:MAG: glycosyltransferase family 39 protein [Steroidobacteraceae bacterium]